MASSSASGRPRPPFSASGAGLVSPILGRGGVTGGGGSIGAGAATADAPTGGTSVAAVGGTSVATAASSGSTGAASRALRPDRGLRVRRRTLGSSLTSVPSGTPVAPASPLDPSTGGSSVLGASPLRAPSGTWMLPPGVSSAATLARSAVLGAPAPRSSSTSPTSPEGALSPPARVPLRREPPRRRRRRTPSGPVPAEPAASTRPRGGADPSATCRSADSSLMTSFPSHDAHRRVCGARRPAGGGGSGSNRWPWRSIHWWVRTARVIS